MIALLLGLLFTILGILGLALYFLPSIIGYSKHHTQRNIILLINFLLGWTFIGWGACLVWSLHEVHPINNPTTNRIMRNVGGNKYYDLAKLQQLRESGVLTEYEFQIEKSKIL